MKKFIFLVLLALAAAVSPAHAKTPGEVEIGGVLREAEMQGLNGPSRKLSEFRGKPLIINVWASYCGPCRQEMASLERLARRYGGGKQFNLIGISIDDYRDRAVSFVDKTGATFGNYIDQQLMLENMLGANMIPLTVLVDARGRVVAKHFGAKEWDGPEALQMISKAFGLKF